MITDIGGTISLNNGVEIPAVGLGCYKSIGSSAVDAIRWATEFGYRHFDTATRYLNEKDVGEGIRACGVPRDKLFLVSKMWPTSFQSPEKAIENSLKELKTDYMDGYLLHWPGTDETARLKAWEAVLKAMGKGLIRAAGVSNFQISHMEGLIAAFGVVPAINQIELHPWYQQTTLTDYCHLKQIAITAWSPIFRNQISEEPLLEKLSEKYGKTPAQITLRWHLQHGNIIIPKSANQQRILENSQLFDFELSEEDMTKIDALESGKHTGADPNTYTGDDFQILE